MKHNNEELVNRIKDIFGLVPEIDKELLFEMKDICDEVRNVYKGGYTQPKKEEYRVQQSIEDFCNKKIVKTDNPEDFITMSMLWSNFKTDDTFDYGNRKKDCKEYLKKMCKFEDRPWINGKQYRSVFKNIKIV